MPQVAEWREQKLEVMRLEAAIAERDRLRCLEQLQKQEQEEKNRRKQQKQQVVHHKLACMADDGSVIKMYVGDFTVFSFILSAIFSAALIRLDCKTAWPCYRWWFSCGTEVY